jgi:ribonuclease D
MAQARDIAPGRVLPDSAIVEAALAVPATVEALAEISVFGGRATRRSLGAWFGAIEAARALPDTELPTTQVVAPGPPPARSWPDRDPAAAARLAALRAEVGGLADEHRLPTENLLSPESLRRLAWSPPERVEVGVITSALTEMGARPWQVELTAGAITRALLAAAGADPSLLTDEESD